MSVAVALDHLAATIAERGSLAYLVTVGDAGPRVVSVEVTTVPGAAAADVPSLCVAAGRHSAANVAHCPAVTLFWPVDVEHPKHTLLIDGTASAATDGGEHRLVIAPGSAMLHRVRAGKGAPPAVSRFPGGVGHR